jgi:Tfp pilus assembly protein PilX
MVEIIVTLLLVGILAAVGGMAIVQAVNGYLVVRNNATLTQKAQLAMTRITREIVEMTGITANATATALPVKNVDRNVTLGLNSGAVKVAPDGTALSSGDTLLDNVSSFALTYYSGTNTFTSWSTTDDIRELSAIDINLQVTHPGGGTLTFQNRVSPRNNKNLGGAAPTAIPPTAPNYGACFVATAAYGDAGHPTVMLLRDFRDRFLLTWGGGQWLVGQYYTHGPAAAALIQDRPVAQWAARCLLFPMAALTFFIVYAPWALPFILLSSLVITGALFSVRRRVRELRPLSPARQQGGIMISLIATMVVMAILGAAMVPLFSASTMNQVYADQGRKTYFLAESGFRYASSQFLNASTEAAKNTVMTNLNNKTCNLLNNRGSFTTVVYPFWTVSQSMSGTTLTTRINGTIPTDLTGAGGYLRAGTSYSYYSYSSKSGSGTTVTFNGLSPATAIAAGQDIRSVALPNSSSTVTNGGNLTLSATGASAFPPLNGNFTLHPTPTGLIGGTVFNYEKRVGNTLQNITLADSTKTWANFTVTSGAITDATSTKITLDKFLRLSSTGSYGGVTREIIYSVPVGWMAGTGDFEKKQYHDQFNNNNNWFTDSTLGTQSASGGSMNVTATVDPTGASGLGGLIRGLLGWGGNGNWAVAAFNWGNTETNLAQAWMDSQGCLSYDIQIKLNTTNTTQPYNFFMGGLGFRMRNSSSNQDLYTYGVSIVRGRQISVLGGSWQNDWLGLGDEGIANELANLLFVGTMEEISGGFLTSYRYSQPAIVFWQRNGPSTGTGSFKVLAYRLLTASDAIVTGTAPALRLKPWSSIMIRLIEGYELAYTNGRNDTYTPARHLKYGDKVRNAAGTKTARVIGTPIVSSGSWSGSNAQGTMILNMVNGGNFNSGEAIQIEGGDSSIAYAMAGSQSSAKANYLMIYFSDNKAVVAGNLIQRDTTRIGNPRDGAYFLADKVWPPDDLTDMVAGLPSATPPGNDYFSIVGGHSSSPMKWTALITTTDGYGHSASFVPVTDTTSDFHMAVIKTDALVTGNWTSSSDAGDFSGDAISLVTSGNSVTSSTPFQYDDFAIQLDLKSGTGFLPPIQQ